MGKAIKKKKKKHAGTTNMASHDGNPTRTLQKMSRTPNNAMPLLSRGRNAAQPITPEALKLSGECYKQKRRER